MWPVVQSKESGGTGKRRGRVEIQVERKEWLFYLQVKKLFEEFYALLQEMLHEWDANIMEGVNKFFMEFLPKDHTYAMTIENMVRLYLAISIDSVRYTEVY
jgi:hypothetical protein